MANPVSIPCGSCDRAVDGTALEGLLFLPGGPLPAAVCLPCYDGYDDDTRAGVDGDMHPGYLHACKVDPTTVSGDRGRCVYCAGFMRAVPVGVVWESIR
jgi:hypothetical protein